MASIPRNLLFAVLLPPVLSAPVLAQQRPSYELPTISLTAPDANDPLHDQALALYEQARWKDAARLYLDAAAKHPEKDAAAYGAYDRAGRLLFYAGEYGEARATMEKAGEVAEATGDLVSAARRYVDAAFCAVWEAYPGKRRELVQKAERISQSDLVGDQDRSHILALTRGVAALPVKER